MTTNQLPNIHILLQSSLPITPFSWLPFAVIAVLSVVMVAAIIYMLSSIIRSERAKQWSRFQIYEAFLSMLFIVAFAALAYLFFLNPQNLFATQLNIVPCGGTYASSQGCTVAQSTTTNRGSTQPMPGCTGATQLFTLASCDLSQFDNATYALAGDAFTASYLIALLPGLEGELSPIPTTWGIQIIFNLPAIVPIASSGQVVTMFYGFALLLLIFNQLQLIVISGAVLFLALFLSVGLVARTLGFTRTFGGAMIAFGLGIGLLFPLLVAITYGYIDVSAGVMYIQSAGTTSIIWSGFTSLVNNPAAATGGIFLDIGYVIAGSPSYLY